MSLPRGDEYYQAIQNPVISFSDIELKNSTVETTPLGLPKPYSGGFTTTFKLKSSRKSWAVRCFTKEIKDLQKRYQSIGNFTNSNNCSFLVDTKYVQDGIRIKGNYYPIIKMDWLEGVPLNIYIDKIYNQKAKLESLLNEFVNLIEQLEGFGIAHGDLQHGNVMVKGGKLFLIDYDGMYFPDLANLSVNELGHPNFQHPRRTSKNYNKLIDRFSSFVIYTAIKAVSVNPNLWRKYENGDNLLFKGSDFINPQNSPLLKELVGHSELKMLANNVAAVCSLEFKNIPSLGTFLNSSIASSTIVLPQVTTVRSAYLVLDGKQKGQLLEHVGERVEVVGKISLDYKKGKTILGDPYVLLNIGDFPNQTFTIALWKEALNKLASNDIIPENFKGKYISIIGVLSVYSSKYYGRITHRPQIALETPSNLQILTSKDEVDNRLNSRKIIKESKTNIVSPKKEINKEDFWDNYLKDKPVTPKPKPSVVVKKPQPVINASPTLNTYTNAPVQSTQTSSSSSSNSSSSSSNSSSSSDNGCMIPIILGIVGSLIIGGLTESGGGAIMGFIIGVWIGLSFSD